MSWQNYLGLSVGSGVGLQLQPSDEIYIAGDPTPRDAVSPLLRRYVQYAMPLPIVSRATRDVAMPFAAELIAALAIRQINN